MQVSSTYYFKFYFHKKIVHHNWILKFEFVLTNGMTVQALSNQEYWKAPSKLKVKSPKWETSIFIFKS